MSKEQGERARATEPARGSDRASMSLPPDRTAQDILLRCLSASREPLAAGREPVDWTAVVALSDNHALTPLLYSRLKENGAQPSLPVDVWERLKRTYVASAVRSMCLHRDLRPALRSLRSSGIKVIALKGA